MTPTPTPPKAAPAWSVSHSPLSKASGSPRSATSERLDAILSELRTAKAAPKHLGRIARILSGAGNGKGGGGGGGGRGMPAGTGAAAKLFELAPSSDEEEDEEADDVFYGQAKEAAMMAARLDATWRPAH